MDTACDGAYLPFAHQRGYTRTPVTDYRFTDQEYDASSGLYNYDARLYDPVIGRLVTASIIVPDWYNSSTLNHCTFLPNWIVPTNSDIVSIWKSGSK